MKDLTSAKIIKDSINRSGDRITTYVLTYPRMIHSEVMTHRVFSRNSASSRAIPFEKMVSSVIENPFVPLAWQKTHKGMQGNQYLSDRDVEVCTSAWLVARNKAVEQAQHMYERGATKQLCNRILEPYAWHTVIVTSTELNNFFDLRCPKYTDGIEEPTHRSWQDFVRFCMNERKANRTVIESLESTSMQGRLHYNLGQAEIHLMHLAEMMWDAYKSSEPIKLADGQWHIPFDEDIDEEKIKDIYWPRTDNTLQDEVIRNTIDFGRTIQRITELKIKVSTAKCARVSYTQVGGEKKNHDPAADIILHDKLLKDGHMSPFEHCAMADGYGNQHGNFKGWHQYRKMIPGENKKYQ